MASFDHEWIRSCKEKYGRIHWCSNDKAADKAAVPNRNHGPDALPVSQCSQCLLEHDCHEPKGKLVSEIAVYAHVPRVYAIARKYYRNWGHKYSMRLDIEDLVQQGIEALIRAWMKFDITHGTMFATYASIAVRRAIKFHIQKNSDIPRELNKRMQLIRECIAELAMVLERWPNEDEIVKALCKEKLFKILERAPTEEEINGKIEETRCEYRNVTKAYSAICFPMNIEGLADNHDDGSEPYDDQDLSPANQCDATASDDATWESFQKEYDRQTLVTAMAILKERKHREWAVLILDIWMEMPQDVIAAVMGIKPNYVRQIKRRAIISLREIIAEIE